MDDERKIITPLRWLFCQSQTDHLLSFIERMRLNMSASRHGGEYQVRLKADGGFRCEGKGGSFKGALADAVAQFATTEQRDYHDVIAAQDRIGL